MGMTNEDLSPQLTRSGSTRYRITVEGVLGDQWSERLGGMRIVSRPRQHRKPLTTLSGRVPDQAALLGVLNCLYELRLKILSLESDANETIHGGQ